MYPICYWQVSGGYLQPEPTMYSRCFHWFPGPLAPSVKKSYIHFSHPVFKLHNMGEGMEVHCGRVSNCLGCLVHPIVRTSSVQDPYPEQAKKNRIIDMSPIHSLKPFHLEDHVGPKVIIKEQVWEDVPPPSVVNNSFIIQFILLHNSMESVLGNLSFPSALHQAERGGKLPHKSTGNVQNLMMGYAPSHQNDR